MSKFSALFLLGGLLLLADDAKLPPPYATPSVANGAKVIPQPDGVALKVPQGFQVTEYASGFKKARVLLGLSDGAVLVSDAVKGGAIYVIEDKNRDGKPDGEKRALISPVEQPYGMAVLKEYLYIAEPTSVKRYKFDQKAMTVGAGEEIIKMPEEFAKGHWTRSMTFDAKGERLYLNVGSGDNVKPDSDERRATVIECWTDGSNCHIFAAGLRNTTGLHFRPGSSDLWATVQERDGLGDDLVPDYFTKLKKDGFYGWPWAYFGPNEEPRNAGKNPELVKKTITPDVSLGAHVAVMDFAFYTGKMFPAKYRGGAFIALRGSSNRSKRVGYSIAFQPFDKSGKPSGELQEFLTGWMLSPDQKEVWGRPVGVTQMADGALLVSEDGGNKLFRVAYGK